MHSALFIKQVLHTKAFTDFGTCFQVKCNFFWNPALYVNGNQKKNNLRFISLPVVATS